MNRFSYHKKLSLIAELSNLTVVITNKNGGVDWVNKVFEENSRFKLFETTGNKPKAFLQGKATDLKTENFIRRQLLKKVSFNVEIANYTKQRELIWLNLFISPIF